MRNTITIALILSFGIFSVPIHAQMTVVGNQSAGALAAKITGPGVTVSNPQLSCPGVSNAIFNNGTPAGVGLNTGVLLTSGSVFGVPGPNNLPGYGQDNGGPGDPDLTSYAGFPTLDRCVLQFDFEAVANAVSIRYVFASEEYLEYVNSEFNDVFAFLVTGPRPGGGSYSNTNIATLPSTNTPVAINTVNHLTNTAYYRNNPQPGITANIEYDGLTVVLTASIEIVPCETYHFKLAIADATDRILDSGVFLEEASFQASILCHDYVLTLGPDGTGSVSPEDLIASDLGACNFTFGLSQSDFVCSDEGENTVVVTATDPAGNVLECEATVTVVVPDGIIDVDLGAGCRTVYFGYGPASCTDLTAQASGGTPPYTYAWSSGEDTETITVCPEATTQYWVTVTDANGCVGEAGPVEVISVDVRCGQTEQKVLICHNPPGNPEGASTLCISPSAVPAHLEHGDYLGDCSVTADPCAEGSAIRITAHRPDAANFEPTAWPNPGREGVMIKLPAASGQPMNIQLIGRLGNVLRQAVIPAGARSFEWNDLGALPGGTYGILVQDADGTTWTLRWMKLD